MAGDLRRARTLYEESLSRNRARGNRSGVAVELVNLATVERTEGNLARAETNLREAMSISREIKNSYLLAASLIVLASVELIAGRLRDAARSLGRADAIYSSTGLVIDPADRADYERTVAGVRSGLGEKAYIAAHAEGEKSALEELTPAHT
jgi:ATP/maltotriose-dependent transcriptional regulator MalT